MIAMSHTLWCVLELNLAWMHIGITHRCLNGRWIRKTLCRSLVSHVNFFYGGLVLISYHLNLKLFRLCFQTKVSTYQFIFNPPELGCLEEVLKILNSVPNTDVVWLSGAAGIWIVWGGKLLLVVVLKSFYQNKSFLKPFSKNGAQWLYCTVIP